MSKQFNMFSILQKPQDSVNAEDLETLQNEIERRLVDVVTQKWELERELVSLNSTSPDNFNNPSSVTNASSATASNLLGGKLRNSHRTIDPSENSQDGFKNTLFGTGNSVIEGSPSCTNTSEDSASSEGSLISSLTGSTIITNNLGDLGSQTCNSNSTSAGTKRSHKGSNDRPSKRFRQNNSNSLSSSGVFAKRPPHSKHRVKIVPSKFRNSLEESRPNKKQTLRNEAPDKLWPFVEQFCATPTEVQIKELEEMIKSFENDKDYFKVPSLGKKESSTKESPTKTDNGSSKNLRKSKNKTGDEESSLGALTQRVVSSFIEETDDTSTDTTKSTNDGTQSSKKKNSRNKSGKSIDIDAAKNLEKRIRQELEGYNILNQQDDIPFTSEEDEILRELVASQYELLSIQNQNKDLMQRLLKKAKRHLELENEREKLRLANAEVIAAYHRLIQAKQRKRNPTKKEKDVAWKALKVQEAIFKRCDELYLSGLSRGGV